MPSPISVIDRIAYRAGYELAFFAASAFGLVRFIYRGLRAVVCAVIFRR